MKKNTKLLYYLLSLVICTLPIFKLGASELKERIIQPKAKKERYEKIINDDKIIDYYHWLQDKNIQNIQNADVITYLKQENEYTENYYLSLKDREKKLIKEMKDKIVEEDKTYPKRFGYYYYYRKFIKGNNYFQVCRKNGGIEAKEEIILDVGKLAEGKSVGYKVSSITPSLDNNLLAYAEDQNGEEKYSISIRDLRNNKFYADVVHNMKGSIVWHGNNKGFFYTKTDDRQRATEVYYHELEKEQSEDILIYKENDNSFLINILRTSDNKYLIINSSNNSENEISILNIKEQINYTPQLLINRKKDQKYSIDHREGWFFIKINDKGKNFRLVKLKEYDFNNRENWVEIIPHSVDSLLLGYSLSKNYLVANIMVDGSTKIVVYDKAWKSQEIKFEEETYRANGYFTTYDSTMVRIDYSSFIVPQSVLEYDCEKNKVYNRNTAEVSGGYDKALYKSEKIYILSEDGVQVPISLFYRKDKFKKDGTNPLLLYGYGAYGVSSFPNFDANLFSLVDRGFVYAIAHIRGGSELGYKWHDDAKLLNKKRTFIDYINCAEGLVEKKYASSKKIVGYGVSAGGLLMGYVINEKPELLRVVVTDVPSVDTLNKMLDENLMGTPFHYTELGNPNIKEYYDYIKSYSPYDNIRRQDYPAIYATAGFLDPRVPYWQPTKWIAKLREYNTSNEPILLYTEMESGHFRQGGRYDSLKHKARMYNFILSNLGILVN